MLREADQRMFEAFLLGNPKLIQLEVLLDEFNFFEAISIVRQEVRLSDFLALLLNPQECHGLDADFAQQILLTAVLPFGHGFHEMAQGLRYTISEPARREVLTRLLQLNHQRHEEEVKAGLHDKGKKSTPSSKGAKEVKEKNNKKKDDGGQMSLF